MSERFDALALKWHRFYRGKLSVALKVPVSSYQDFAVWYTPGVAEPCREIAKDPNAAYEYTNKGNSVAVVTDGSRVLGLGNIGSTAGMPVMEGKALLFKYLGDVDAFPICLGTQDPDEIIQAVKWIAPGFGGINIEDVDAPKCFYIAERLTEELDIPLFHDDQQGTAVVTLAGLINALKLRGSKIGEVTFANLGAGAAGIAVAKLLIAAGADPGKMVLVDSRGILYKGRGSMDKWKEQMAEITNREGKTGGIAEAMKGADVVIGLSKPGPGVITEPMVRSMADNPVVFALANPWPEIYPDEARKAGARIVATGRSDFPNQINNSLGFPAIFRGLLDTGARVINTEMLLAAAYELAACAEEKGLREDYIMPTMDEVSVYAREAAAVAEAAVRTGVARIKLTREEVRARAEERITQVQRLNHFAAREGFMKPLPP
ncbi:MAG: NADP-dependent malic enzyme [Candidatus Bathyarchaeia archaeon]